MEPEELILVFVHNLFKSAEGDGYVLFLKAEGDNRLVPMSVGPAEAFSIICALQGDTFARPLSHVLFKNVLDRLNSKVEKLAVHELRDGTYFATLHIRAGGELHEFDSRPSDGIALALRHQAPVYIARTVFEESAIEIPMLTSESGTEAALEKLRRDLEMAVTEERYEDAARIRDQIQQTELDDLTHN